MTKRIALVTGGMGGIGTAVCRKLAKSKDNVVVANCLPGYAQKDEWLQQMRKDGFDNVHAAEGDVSDFASTVAMVKKIESEIGPVDILINNAGIVRDNVLKKASETDWTSVINSNLNSVFNVTRNVIDGMAERGWGRVINMSSVNGQRGQFGQTNYSASKAGVHGFSMALAAETARKGITVNTVSPGYVDSPMIRAVPEDIRGRILDGIPAGRFGQPQDIATAVTFLCAEQSGFITGANLPVNGGQFMSF